MKKGSYNLESLSDKLLERDSYFQKLKNLSTQKNYTYKLTKIKERLLEELQLWERKNPSAKLLDLQKDLNFLNTQTDEKNLDKYRIDILSQKYSIYG
jgi:hypothetical protein